ncbi:43599_t:CDS:2 [Gigaspora margarita]|uniref:43599_t:CDS:1 n=1 Tax=Gigaspora margarita TaxID=4874 RepID=A0ABN7UGH8_GIGMA|nr:43599_t:CDS:2 [Gigaspora margarita]
MRRKLDLGSVFIIRRSKSKDGLWYGEDTKFKILVIFLVDLANRKGYQGEFEKE